MSALPVWLLAACASHAPLAPDQPYCFQAPQRSGVKLTCTPGPVPGESANRQAKTLDGVPNRLTVYIVRHHWGDTVNQVSVGTASGLSATTVPDSFVRLVLPPGTHRLEFQWSQGRGGLQIDGQAGDTVFVELNGHLGLLRQEYRMSLVERSSVQGKVMDSRLVADLASTSP